jgi:hypothetical protein
MHGEVQSSKPKVQTNPKAQTIEPHGRHDNVCDLELIPLFEL